MKNSDNQNLSKIFHSYLGNSILGESIQLLKIGNGKCRVLLIAGVHGDEVEGVVFLDCLIKGALLMKNQSEQKNKRSRDFSFPNLTLYVIPVANPDGYAQCRRTNQYNVDLNRNFPTKDWTSTFQNTRYYPGREAGSEPETRATMNFLAQEKPQWIISFHSYKKALINYNGRSKKLAQTLAEDTGLPVVASMGYPTPGSLGTYAGVELDTPTITYEFLKGESASKNWQCHSKAIVSGLQMLNDEK